MHENELDVMQVIKFGNKTYRLGLNFQDVEQQEYHSNPIRALFVRLCPFYESLECFPHSFTKLSLQNFIS